MINATFPRASVLLHADNNNQHCLHRAQDDSRLPSSSPEIVDHEPRIRSSSLAEPGAAWQKQQWEAKLASFQRGLAHVMQCTSSDACGSSLCHATRRLMRTYATHDCTQERGRDGSVVVGGGVVGGGGSPVTSQCKICKLMGFLMSKTKHGAVPMVLRRPTNPTTNMMSCGQAYAAQATTPSATIASPMMMSMRSMPRLVTTTRKPTRATTSTVTSQLRMAATQDVIKAMVKRV